MRLLYVALALALASSPAIAEGPATGPSSQGGKPADVAPTGVEKPLDPARQNPDPSEGRVPSPENASLKDMKEPKVDVKPKTGN